MTCEGNEDHQVLQQSSKFCEDEEGRPTNTLLEAFLGLALQQEF